MRSDTVKKTISVGTYPMVRPMTQHQAVTDVSCYCNLLPPQDKIYVANTLSNSVSVIDGNSDTVKKTISVGTDPTFILVSDNNQEVYAVCDDAVYVIDPKDGP